MDSRLNTHQIARAVQALNLSYDDLARRLEVLPAAVTQWLSGEAFPAANRLLKLSFILNMSFDDMVVNSSPKLPEPVVAYRRKAQKITTEVEIELARTKGRLLRPLASYLDNRHVKAATFREPSQDYNYIQQVVSDLRKSIGMSDETIISYGNLIAKFNELGAVLIPAMWGERERHGNALHIFLPESNATWVYLNLDANVCDFNFWMAHELAHVFTPDLAGSNEGEDFADAFAGALLYPRACAAKLYQQLTGKHDGISVNLIKAAAQERVISPYTVYLALNNYAKHNGLPVFKFNIFGAMKNFEKQFPTVTHLLFPNGAPDAATYIAATKQAFFTPFFDILASYLRDSAQGPGWLAEVLETSILDAKEMYLALGGDAS